MNTKDFSNINRRALEKVKELRPDFTLFDNGRNFMEMYDKGEAFVQVFYYNKMNGSSLGQAQFNMAKEKEQELIQQVRTYNEKLKEAQVEVLDEMGIDEYSRKNYFYFNRVGDDIGVAHFHTYVRNKVEEEKEEAKRETEQEKYLVVQGPYGGAFRDYEDLIRYKEGTSFLKN